MTRALAGKVLLGIAALGVLASLVAVVTGIRSLLEIEAALGRSLTVTGEALASLDASVEVAGESLTILERSLESTESTTRDLLASFEDAEHLLEATAEVSEDQIASSLEAVEDALPTLIEVASVIDTTLSALSLLPFGPAYDPDEPFDDSLRAIQREMAGLPDDVREQAELIRATGANLGAVRDGTAAIADELAALRGTVRQAAELLDGYAATATETRAAVDETEAALAGRLRLARVLLVVLALVMAAGQVVPFGLGWFLLHPVEAEAFLYPAAHPDGGQMPDGTDWPQGQGDRPADRSRPPPAPG